MRKRRAAPSFLHPLGGPDAKRLGWGRSLVLDQISPFALSLSKGSQGPFDEPKPGFDGLSPTGVMGIGNFHNRSLS